MQPHIGASPLTIRVFGLQFPRGTSHYFNYFAYVRRLPHEISVHLKTVANFELNDTLKTRIAREVRASSGCNLKKIVFGL